MNIVEGAFPISIGTSMAIESIAKADRVNEHDPDRIPPKLPMPVGDYNTLHLNLTTLVRNRLGGMEDPYAGSSNDVVMGVDEELALIQEVIPSTTRINLYTNKLDKLKRNLPDNLREIRTDKQIKSYKRLMSVTDSLKSYYKGSNNEVSEWSSETIAVDRDNSLIITHEPISLIHSPKFKKLHLLESHTGVVKTSKDYYSKFYPMPKMSLERIPFTLEMLLIFGDRSTFKPLNAAYRRSVLDLAATRRWTYMTTANKIRKNMKLLDNANVTNHYNEIRKKI